MQAASRASAGDARRLRANAPSPEQHAAARPATSHARLTPLAKGEGLRLALFPEALRIFFRRSIDTIAANLRRGWFYRLGYRGSITDRIEFHPLDWRARRLDEADAYFRGRFRFAGHMVEAKTGSIFDAEMPSAGFAASLHGFEWLRHLEAASGEAARLLALKLAGEWLDRNEEYTTPAWDADVIAIRFFNLFSHGRFFLVNSDLLWRSRLFVSLRNQTRILARTLHTAPEGLPRLRAAAGLSLAGLCLSDPRSADLGLKRLADEIAKQILPDGGHISRSPETLVEAFRILGMVQQVADAANRETQNALRSALDRMAPMVRFFRLGDGGLGVFNGGGEGDTKLVAALLERDDVQGKPFGHAPHSAYQRLSGGRSLVLMDIGDPPPGAYATHAHAGCLSFEMSVGAHRLIVNCGIATTEENEWSAALRATAAHSALILADRSSASLLPPGFLRNQLGARLLADSGKVQTRRTEGAQGIIIEASHDYYVPRFGLTHRRRLALSPKGLVLTGTDQLIPVGAKAGKRGPERPFDIRFHIHPDVRLSLAQGGGSVILKLPNGEGWRFRCGGGAIAIEESVYLGGGALRRCEQLVISATIRNEETEIAWLLEQIGAN
jgi:uncharacterized heparinase superfamily protein